MGKKYLFIGGPKDGERLEVPDDQPYWQICEIENIDFNDWKTCDLDSFCINYTKHEYIKFPFRDSMGDRLFVYSYRGVNPMKMLLDGYRKGKRKTKKKFKLY